MKKKRKTTTTKRKTTTKKKSTVNAAGNYTKPTMRKNLFNKIKAGKQHASHGLHKKKRGKKK